MRRERGGSATSSAVRVHVGSRVDEIVCGRTDGRQCLPRRAPEWAWPGGGRLPCYLCVRRTPLPAAAFCLFPLLPNRYFMFDN
ncbi:hypothetical protein Y032_0065g3602 [Ancylostoma ceylanicum]|uniref:Uncharacterized protein n=1 Tax=Ancylostoma ceylanicum TaxID=53326 RepID=A0A016U140_9BILA|nr:hypothetical protein Y032_0065g3602 [Ancylostoma ceylanicum]